RHQALTPLSEGGRRDFSSSSPTGAFKIVTRPWVFLDPASARSRRALDGSVSGLLWHTSSHAWIQRPTSSRLGTALADGIGGQLDLPANVVDRQRFVNYLVAGANSIAATGTKDLSGSRSRQAVRLRTPRRSGFRQRMPSGTMAAPIFQSVGGRDTPPLGLRARPPHQSRHTQWIAR